MIGSYAGTIGSKVVMFVMVCFEGHSIVLVLWDHHSALFVWGRPPVP